MEILLLVAGFNAAKIGLDRWVIPFMRTRLTQKNRLNNTVEA